MSPVVSLRDVTFRYAGAPAPALVHVTLELEPGSVTVVTGAAGAGASTLLLVATGYAPRLVGGVLGGERQIAGRCAIVFARPWTQLTGLCGTVRDEVAFGPAARGLPRAAALEAAARAMARLGVSHLAGRDPAQLSGGELQRVVVAAAFALGPDLLALDDPAAELDPAGADELYALLPVLAGSGTAVLIATPDLDRAAAVATRGIALEAGRVVADGPPAAVLDGTEVAGIARAAGCPAPYPADLAALLRRVAGAARSEGPGGAAQR